MFSSPFSSWIIGTLLVIAPALWLGENHAGLVEEHDLPQSLRPGETYTATWSLAIHQTSGFARFQVEFPQGIEVAPQRTEGASFTFQDGKAKFIWIEIPQKRTLELTLELTATQEFRGGTVTQWFSFIQDGSRKDVEFDPHPIALERSENAGSGEIAQNPANARPTKPLTAQRSWKPDANGTSGVMTITLSEFEPGQFLKLTERIPAEVECTPVNDAQADIRDRFDDQLEYIWQAPAEAETLTVSYRIGYDAACDVTGTVAAVKNNQAISITVPAWMGPPPSGKGASDASISYRVQVLATHQKVETNSVRRLYAFPGELRREVHDQWFKFTNGFYSTYPEARNQRVNLSTNHDFPGPFVTAYRGSERISVQEALLITHQTWIP